MLFKDFTAREYGARDSDRILGILAGFGIKSPKDGQWFQGNKCHMVFDNRTGLIVKVLDVSLVQKYTAAGEPLFVLQGLKRHRFDNSEVMLLPGVSLKPLGKTVENPGKYLERMASDYGLIALDADVQNRGFLKPVVLGAISMPIYVDHGSVLTISEQNNTQGAFDQTAYTGLQQKIFERLHVTLEGMSLVDVINQPHKTLKFRNMCSDIIAFPDGHPEKCLYKGWLEQPREVNVSRSRKIQRVLISAHALEQGVSGNDLELEDVVPHLV